MTNDVSTEDLQGTWTLVEYLSSHGMVEPSMAGRETPHLLVEGDRIAGTMGVNRLMGQVGDDGLPGSLATTMMAGPTELMEQETTALRHLQDADAVTIEGDRLIFWKEGSPVLELEASSGDDQV